MKKFELGLWFLAISVIGLASYEYYASQKLLTAYVWTPVYLPINLNQVAGFSYAFTADKDTSYYIYLDVERQREFEKLQCLIGAAFLESQCPAESSHLNLDWEVLVDNSAVASGSTLNNAITHSYWTHNVGKGIGVFDARKNNHYTVNLHLNQPLPEIMVLHPRIKIAMHPREFKAAQREADITGLVTVSLVAFVVLLVAGFYFYKERHLKQSRGI